MGRKGQGQGRVQDASFRLSQHAIFPSTHFMLAVKKAYLKEIQSIEIRTEGNNDG